MISVSPEEEPEEGSMLIHAKSSISIVYSRFFIPKLAIPNFTSDAFSPICTVVEMELTLESILESVGGNILTPGLPPLFSDISQFLGSLANSLTNILSIEYPEFASGDGHVSEARYLTESIVIYSGSGSLGSGI